MITPESLRDKIIEAAKDDPKHTGTVDQLASDIDAFIRGSGAFTSDAVAALALVSAVWTRSYQDKITPRVAEYIKSKDEGVTTIPTP